MNVDCFFKNIIYTPLPTGTCVRYVSLIKMDSGGFKNNLTRPQILDFVSKLRQLDFLWAFFQTPLKN
jgi:hypothetical protein